MKIKKEIIAQASLVLIGVGFIGSLIPSVISIHKPDPITSIGMMLLLTWISISYIMLRLRYAAAVTIGQVTVWGILLAQAVSA